MLTTESEGRKASGPAVRYDVCASRSGPRKRGWRMVTLNTWLGRLLWMGRSTLRVTVRLPMMRVTLRVMVTFSITSPLPLPNSDVTVSVYVSVTVSVMSSTTVSVRLSISTPSVRCISRS